MHVFFYLSRFRPLLDAAGEGGSGASAGGGDASANPPAGGSFFQPSPDDARPSGQAGGDGAPASGESNGGAPSSAVGDAPDWLISKFAVNGEDGKLDLNASMEKQAQGYRDLYGSYSKKTDALKAEVAQEYAQTYAQERGVPEKPEDYAYPDGVTPPGEEIDGTLRQWAKENNVGAEAFQALINDVWMATQPNHQAELERLGKTDADRSARLDKVNKWISANMDEADHGTISRIMQTADGVAFMEKIAKLEAPSGFAPDTGSAQAATPLTRAAIRELQADPKFGADEKYTKMVRDKWQAYAALPPEKQV